MPDDLSNDITKEDFWHIRNTQSISKVIMIY